MGNSFEQRDNSGVLFKNDRREKDTHPNYKGNARVDGVDYFFDVWVKTDKNGNKYMSASFKRKEKQSAPVPDRQQQARDGYRDRATTPKQPDVAPKDDDDLDSSIPF